MRLQFVGSGDAFGSGGRFNTCFHLTGARSNLLIDCGASSLIAMKRLRVSRNDVQAILITHFHADHFGGVPFFILEAQFFSKRSQALTIAGPPGLEDWYTRVMETAFPGSSATAQRFPLALRELEAGELHEVAGVAVRPFPVNHGNVGGPFYAYRLEAEGKVFAYSGDTEWCDNLVAAGQGADLLVAEAYFRDKKVPLHLDLASLEAHVAEIDAKRVILTHMSEEMLARSADVPFEVAHDGLLVEF